MTLLPHPWLSARDLADEPGLRLFCLPHAGAGAAAYNRWRRLLPPWVRVCPVQLPGREMRLAERSSVDAAALVRELLGAIRPLLGEPYAVFGHSMGALLGYELARQIELADLPAPEVLFCSGRNAPHLTAPHRELHKLPDVEFVEALRVRYGGIPEGFLEDGELREVFLPILRADLTLVERYRPSPGVLLRCPVRASAGDRDFSVSEAGLDAWRELTAADVRVKRFPGDHFYHLGDGQDGLLEWIGEGIPPPRTV